MMLMMVMMMAMEERALGESGKPTPDNPLLGHPRECFAFVSKDWHKPEEECSGSCWTFLLFLN